MANSPIVFIAAMPVVSLAPAKEPHSASEYFRRGVERLTDSDYDGAIEDFTIAIVLNSKFSPRAPKQMSGLSRKADNDRSLHLPGKLVVMDRFNAAAYFNLASARLFKGGVQGTIRDLDKDIAIDPNNIDAVTNRGIAKHKTGDTVGALSDFNRAIQLNSRHSVAYSNRGSLRADLKDFRGRDCSLYPRYRDWPSNGSGLQSARQCIRCPGEPEKACRDFNKAIGLNPGIRLHIRSCMGRMVGGCADASILPIHSRLDGLPAALCRPQLAEIGQRLGFDIHRGNTHSTFMLGINNLRSVTASR